MIERNRNARLDFLNGVPDRSEYPAII